MSTTAQQTSAPEPANALTPGQSVVWLKSLGGRGRNSWGRGRAIEVPAVVRSVGKKLVTIETERGVKRVEAGRLELRRGDGK